MALDPLSNIKSQSQKSKRYFIISYIFFVAMALSWSIDTSLVYILFGIAVYFLFLCFYNRPFRKNKFSRFEKASTASSPASEPSTTVSDAVKNIFQKNPAYKESADTQLPKLPLAANRKTIKAVVLGVFATIFIFLIGSVVSTDEDSDESVFYYQTAEQNYWSQNYDSAYLNYRKAWKLNPDYAEAVLGYGNVLTMRKQQDSAMIMIDRALEINPDYKEASYSKALVYYNQEKYSESIGVLKQVIDDNPDYYDAMLLIGDAFYAQTKYDEAIPYYENAYTNGGARSRMLCHIMAYIYDTKGDYDKAIDLYKEALSYDSTVVDIYKRLGELIPNEDGNFYRIQAVKLQAK